MTSTPELPAQGSTNWFEWGAVLSVPIAPRATCEHGGMTAQLPGIPRQILDGTCAHCSRSVRFLSRMVARRDQYGNGAPDLEVPYMVLECPSCARATIANLRRSEGPDAPQTIGAFHAGTPAMFSIAPGPLPMPRVQGMPEAMEQCWNEALDAGASEAWTAAELMCRKLLMHIAVTQFGMPEGKSFAEYVKAIDDHRYFPPAVHKLVDGIRERGNRATHDIRASSRTEALATLRITHHVLHSIYELAVEDYGAPL